MTIWSSGSCWRNPQRQLALACGNLGALDKQLGSLHEIEQGSLYEGDSYIAWLD